MSRIVRFYEKGVPEVLKIEDVEVPPPGPDEVSIQVKALSLNRAEAAFRSGRYLEEPERASAMWTPGTNAAIPALASHALRDQNDGESRLGDSQNVSVSLAGPR
jgi:NADPH:quinone reductase-like Zn-dependent oxidoreductase